MAQRNLQQSNQIQILVHEFKDAHSNINILDLLTEQLSPLAL